MKNKLGLLKLYCPILPVTDLRATRRWYEEKLGFRTFYEEGTSLIAVDVGGDESKPISFQQTQLGTKLDRGTLQHVGMAFKVEDAKALYQKLQASDVEVEAVTQELG